MKCGGGSYPLPVLAQAGLYTPRRHGSTIRPVTDDTPPAQRRETLKELYRQARGCEQCAQLVAGRTQVVFGGGNADADVMLVVDTPGPREDEQGTTLVGAAGKLIDELLAGVGLRREEVFITHALKCRPAGNREASPSERERCAEYLLQQVALVQPLVICALGSEPTRQLLGDSAPLSDVHGRPRTVAVGDWAAHVLPLYHPSAALYTRPMLEQLQEDLAQLPALLARPVVLAVAAAGAQDLPHTPLPRADA